MRLRGHRGTGHRDRPGSKDSRHWTSATWACIDFETTGLDLRRDEVISVGAVDIHESRVDSESEFYTLCRPTRPSAVSAIEVHGITETDLATAPSAGDVASQLEARLTQRLIIAHAAWIEDAFLSRWTKDHSVALNCTTVDTAALARAAGVVEAKHGSEPGLEYLATRLKLPIFTPHHALGDSFTTAVVFLALTTRLERQQGSPLTVSELAKISSGHPCS